MLLISTVEHADSTDFHLSGGAEFLDDPARISNLTGKVFRSQLREAFIKQLSKE